MFYSGGEISRPLLAFKHWLELKNEGKSVANYFEDMVCQHIAIYGMAYLANRLMEDLLGSFICVDYGIDRDICCSSTRIDNAYFSRG